MAVSLPVGHVGETEEIAHAYLYCMTETFATGSVLHRGRRDRPCLKPRKCDLN